MADVRSRSSLWIKIGLGLYACICLVLFIWMRFSYDSLKYRVEDALSGVLGAPVVLGHIQPNLLWGFKVEGIEIKGTQVARKLTITPRPWEIFRNSLGFGFHADLTTGTTEGRMRFPFKKSKRPMEITIDMANVDLAGLSALFPPNLSPKGTVSGEFNLMTSRDSLDKAIGNCTLSWKKGSLPLGMASLPFDALTFENLDLDGTIDKGLLNIEKVEFTGDFSGTMTGSIRLAHDFMKSRLNITGEVTLPEVMRKALGTDSAAPGQSTRFSLRGSMDKPRFRMLGSYPGRMARRAVSSALAAPVQVPAPAEKTVPEKTNHGMTPPSVSPDQEEDEGLDQEDENSQQLVEPEGE